MYDWIIVGAGLTGATLAERIAAGLGRRVLVVERRRHVAGNAHDAINEHGHLVHTYGPHVFHTNARPIWDYLSRFTAWRPYSHRVRAVVDGTEVPLPINLDAIASLFPGPLAERYTDKLLDRFGFGERVPVLKLRGDDDPDLRDLGNYVYEAVFETYTLKQWGLRPEDLSPSVTARVPIVVSRDSRYTADRWQAMPARGFTAMVERMLAHPSIHVLTNAHWEDVEDMFAGARVIFTGPIDEYFDYIHGPLPYRSLRLEFETLPVARHQSVAVVNHPGEADYTRVTEFAHLTGATGSSTTIAREYPLPHVPGETEPYYPIPCDETQSLLHRYQETARETPDVLFCGRLGDYKYYNMDQAVGAALALYEKRVKPLA